MRARPSGSPQGSRLSRSYRSSRRRLLRVTLVGNSSWQIWVLVLWVLFLLFVVLPWMSRRVGLAGDVPPPPGGSVPTTR